MKSVEDGVDASNGVLFLGCKVSIGVADVVWSWTSKDVKIRQAKEEDVVKGWDRLSKTRHAIQYSSWAHLGGYRYAKVSLERKGKLKIIGRETALIYFGRFCQVQNDGRKSLSLQIVMGHGKYVGERKLTSMQLQI